MKVIAPLKIVICCAPFGNECQECQSSIGNNWQWFFFFYLHSCGENLTHSYCFAFRLIWPHSRIFEGHSRTQTNQSLQSLLNKFGIKIENKWVDWMEASKQGWGRQDHRDSLQAHTSLEGLLYTKQPAQKHKEIIQEGPNMKLTAKLLNLRCFHRWSNDLVATEENLQP